jgi:hypothetical protein
MGKESNGIDKEDIEALKSRLEKELKRLFDNSMNGANRKGSIYTNDRDDDGLKYLTQIAKSESAYILTNGIQLDGVKDEDQHALMEAANHLMAVLYSALAAHMGGMEDRALDVVSLISILLHRAYRLGIAQGRAETVLRMPWVVGEGQ